MLLLLLMLMLAAHAETTSARHPSLMSVSSANTPHSVH
jgi:hypothetical protein